MSTTRSPVLAPEQVTESCWLEEYIDNCCLTNKERLVIFHNWTSCQEVLQIFLAELGWAVWAIKKDDELPAQLLAVQRFNDPNCPIQLLLVNHTAVGVGLNFNFPLWRIVFLRLPGSLARYIAARERLANANEAAESTYALHRRSITG